MTAARIFVVFALLGGVVMIADAAGNGTISRLGGDPRTWGPPLHSSHHSSSPTIAPALKYLFLAIMGIFVLHLLLG